MNNFQQPLFDGFNQMLVLNITEWKSEAKPKSGIWFFTQWKGEADLKIYYTDFKGEADLKVFFTKWKSEAKWAS